MPFAKLWVLYCLDEKLNFFLNVNAKGQGLLKALIGININLNMSWKT
jgi:hypothetical protein